MTDNKCPACGQTSTPATVTDQIIAAQKIALEHDLILVPVPIDSTGAAGDVHEAIDKIFAASMGPFQGGEE